MDRTDDADVWSRFARDPRRAEHAGLRASDAEREVVREVLATAYADGRLDRDELEQRQDRLDATRALGELPPLLADLVADTPDRAPVSRRTDSLVAQPDAALLERAEAAWRSERRSALIAFLTPSLICWAIWISQQGGTFPWPLIVSAATLANLLRVQLSHHDRVSREAERLERRRAQQLRQRELGEA